MKDTKDAIAEAVKKWQEEDQENRSVLLLMTEKLDEQTAQTKMSLVGPGILLVGAIASRCEKDEKFRLIIEKSLEVSKEEDVQEDLASAMNALFSMMNRAKN